jgi:DNA polymerase I
MPKKTLKRYMLVDGNGIVHRAFHAIAPLSTKSGEPTNAVYGFSVLLLRAIQDIKPTHVALTFDLPKPTFRHEKYEEYKAHRVKSADELYQQIPRCKDVVRALGIPIYEEEGYEADDVLGTLACTIREQNKGEENFEVIIVTGDLDTLQLVDDRIKVYTSRKGLTDVVIYDRQAVFDRYGITPEQFVDFKSIKGDPSDNIPGIRGIGEKGALDLIKEYGSVENILKNLDKLKERTRKMFEEQQEQLEMSRDLSKIVCDVKMDANVPEYVFAEKQYRDVAALFQELEFRSLVAKLPKVSQVSGEDLIESAEIAGDVEKKKLDPSNSNYKLVATVEDLNALTKLLLSVKEFGFDTETVGLDFGAELLGIAIAVEAEKAFYVPVEVLVEAKKSHESHPFFEIWENEKIAKVAHNAKFDMAALRVFGINTKGITFDTMLASYLLSPGSRTHDLDTLVFDEFGYTMQPITDLIGKGKNQTTLKEVPLEQVSAYSCEDVDFTYRLKDVLQPRLQKEDLEKIFTEIEMPLISVLANVEQNGIALNTDLYKKLSKEVLEELVGLEKQIFKMAGEEFNINSPTQLKVILFEKLQIPVKGDFTVKKTKTGYSTAASELEKMRGVHPIVDAILAYRELSKLQSTYISALPDMVSPIDKRIHTNYNQTIAATGRLSSTNPNLQNIPVGSVGVASQIRKGFVAAPGYKLLSIDYSQIELRVVAHLSDDKAMIDIFKSGKDIHAATAMQMYGLSGVDQVTSDMRRNAKTVNFGVLYGVSAFGLTNQSNMSRAEASDFIKTYFNTFKGVDQFLKNVVEETRKKGYAINELGRKRYFPEINSSQFLVRAGAERAAINMPVQSLAADIIKLAMLEIAKQYEICSEEFKMLLQVHDELVFEVREDLVQKYAQPIADIMRDSYKLKVPLEVGIKFGDNWGEMQEL